MEINKKYRFLVKIYSHYKHPETDIFNLLQSLYSVILLNKECPFVSSVLLI